MNHINQSPWWNAVNHLSYPHPTRLSFTDGDNRCWLSFAGQSRLSLFSPIVRGGALVPMHSSSNELRHHDHHPVNSSSQSIATSNNASLTATTTTTATTPQDTTTLSPTTDQHPYQPLQELSIVSKINAINTAPLQSTNTLSNHTTMDQSKSFLLLQCPQQPFVDIVGKKSTTGATATVAAAALAQTALLPCSSTNNHQDTSSLQLLSFQNSSNDNPTTSLVPLQNGKKRRSATNDNDKNNKNNNNKKKSKTSKKKSNMSTTHTVATTALATTQTLPFAKQASKRSCIKNVSVNNKNGVSSGSSSENATTLSTAPSQMGTKRGNTKKSNTCATATQVGPPKKEKKPRKKYGRWSTQEDEALKLAIAEQEKQFGRRTVKVSWNVVAEQAGLEQRTAKQCGNRWDMIRRPGVKKGKWTLQEEEAIYQMYQTLGPKWSAMAEIMPNRTKNDIKNKWYSTIRKNKILAQQSSSQPQKLDTTMTAVYSLSNLVHPATVTNNAATSSASSADFDTSTITQIESV